MITRVKTASELRAMRTSGKILATILDQLQNQVKPGMSSKQLAEEAASELKKLGGQPAFLGYQGFPDVICVSINNEIVHGIPKVNKIINEGDIVSLDFGVTYKGMITDSAVSLIVGKPKSQTHIDLVSRTKKALEIGIGQLHDQVRTGDVGSAIEDYLNKYKYGIVRDLVGHGTGHYVHEDPNIPNYGRPNTGPWLQKGMTVAIEPMVTLGSERIIISDDGWTILTADGSWAAHFEHTVLISKDGAEILTTT
ncbi:MAG TPA: type I methionyl aminopeptidase [Candidatus Saccharimonadales bacterium]|nr:type I methionyl aminopeptidase [Candidatus Saccharimonadales bacterium]